jgi:hypothetical protein
LAAEAAARNPGSSQRNVPGNPEHTQSSASQPSHQSQPSQTQQADALHGRVETLPDHGLPPPFYQNWSSNQRGDLRGGIYPPRTDDGAQQHRPPPEPSTPHQQSASASALAPPSASTTAHATSGHASGSEELYLA